MAKEKKTKLWDARSLFVFVGLVFVILFFVLFFQTLISAGNAVASSSSAISSSASSASSAVTSSSSSSLESVLSTSSATPLLSLPSHGTRILMADSAASSSLSFGDKVAFMFTYENLINLVFMALALIFFVAFFIGVLRHKKVSHIGFILVGGVLMVVYLICRTVYCFQNVSSNYKLVMAGLLYCLAIPCSIYQVYRFVLKALDGDAVWQYSLTTGLTIVLIFLAEANQYSLLDTYSHINDYVFWSGYLASRFMLYLDISIVYISVTCDYDPNPIELDEFGNPIDHLKEQVIPKKEAKSSHQDEEKKTKSASK
jgi:hypothetical protein